MQHRLLETNYDPERFLLSVRNILAFVLSTFAYKSLHCILSAIFIYVGVNTLTIYVCA